MPDRDISVQGTPTAKELHDRVLTSLLQCSLLGRNAAGVLVGKSFAAGQIDLVAALCADLHAACTIERSFGYKAFRV